MANIQEQVRQAWREVMSSEFKESHSEKVLRAEIKRLDEKIELGFSFRDRLTALETKVNALISR